MKILILGGNGMLGHILIKKFLDNPNYKIFDITRHKVRRKNNISCDVSDFDLLFEIVQKIRPNFIINCVGVLIKDSLQNPSNAIIINALLPHKLAQFSKTIDAKLIHISTDCVFDGSKGNYYVETDIKTAQDTYGLSKSLGEINDSENLTFRTSIIGPELKKNGEGLFTWFINQKGEVNGFTESIWGGVTTLVLSDIIIKSIKEDITGLIHVTNGEPISKYDLLKLIKEKFNLTNIKLISVPGKKSNKSLKTNYNYFDIPTYYEMVDEMRNFYLKNY